MAEKNGKRVYLQVAYMLNDEATVNREFGILLKIKDSHRKYVVTMDEYNANSNYKGVEQIHLKDFLVAKL